MRINVSDPIFQISEIKSPKAYFPYQISAYLNNYIDLQEHLEDCNKNGKLVCAICASPAVVLGNTNVLQGKKWTCYPGMKDEAKNESVKSSFHQENERVVLDDNVLTACAEGASEEFAIKLVELLAGKEAQQSISKGCCLR